jgi:hypothetical protein
MRVFILFEIMGDEQLMSFIIASICMVCGGLLGKYGAFCLESRMLYICKDQGWNQRLKNHKTLSKLQIRYSNLRNFHRDEKNDSEATIDHNRKSKGHLSI